MEKTWVYWVLALIFITGCHKKKIVPGPVHTMDEILGVCSGESVNCLLIKWGPPTQIIESSGEQIYVYSSSTVLTEGSNRGYPYSNINSSTYIATKHEEYKMFWVDKYGVVYKWNWGKK